MLIQQHKNSPIATNQSWYTPHKHKNVSFIETNPSMNTVTFPSNQYSSIELSQSIAASPSFFSPNKELGSFLMTPNYPSKSQLSFGSELNSELRLKTQSLADTSKFYDVNDESKKSSQQLSPTQINQLMRLIQQVRLMKMKKQNNSKKLVQQTSIQSFLLKEISDKEQSILAHKLQVEQKIRKKNKLSQKLKTKKQKTRQKSKSVLNDLQSKIEKLREEYQLTQELINLEFNKVGRYQQELNNVYHQMQQNAQNRQNYPYQVPYGYPYPYPPYYMYPNPQQNMLDSSARQINLANIPGFNSNPSSSRSQNMKKSNQSKNSVKQKPSKKSGQNVLDTLQNHITSIMKGSGQSNKQKLRKFSFGENPSFNMYAYEQNQAQNKYLPKKKEDNKPIDQNLTLKALFLKMNQVRQQQNQNNPQANTLYKKSQQQANPFITQQFEGISPIASMKKVKFNDLARKSLEKNEYRQGNYTEKNQLEQIIGQLANQDEQYQFELQNYDESQIDINEDRMLESKSSPRRTLKRRLTLVPGEHQRTSSNQTGKKSLKHPLNIQQSQVNIACESSTYSDNLQRHDFSPRKQQEVYKRMRSPTHQVVPVIFEETNQLRKTQNKLKGSNNHLGESSKHSGADTPIFRSQNSEQEANLGFSKPFLGGSLKESQMLEESSEQLQNKILKNQQKEKYTEDQQRAYRTELINPKAKSKENYSVYQTHNLKTIQVQKQDAIEEMNESDDDFFSCTLNTQSKVFVESTIKSREQNQRKISEENNKAKQENRVQSSRARYDHNKPKQESKDVNLVLENVKNRNYDMSLNLSQLGNKKYQKQSKRLSVEMPNNKTQSVYQELQSYHQSIEYPKLQNDEVNKESKMYKDQSKYTL